MERTGSGSNTFKSSVSETNSLKSEVSSSLSSSKFDADMNKSKEAYSTSKSEVSVQLKGGIEKSIDAYKNSEDDTKNKMSLGNGKLEASKVAWKNNTSVIENNEKKSKSPNIEDFMHGSDLETKMNNMRANPEETLASINKSRLAERIDKNNAFEALPKELRKPDADTDAKNAMLEKINKENRGKYIDSLKAKGFLQEEMLRSVLKDDFTVSEKTEQSIHEDGSKTFTDIVATEAKRNLVIGSTEIKQGESVEIESKAGDEKYLSNQINHINKQLEGMNEDSHKFLVVTADFGRMSDEKKEQLVNTVKSHDAELIVMPYYAIDLQNTILHMPSHESNSEKNSTKSDSEKSGKKTEDSIMTKNKASLKENEIEEKNNESQVENTENLSEISDDADSKLRFFDRFRKKKTENTENNDNIKTSKIEFVEKYENDKSAVEKMIEEKKLLNEINEEEKKALVNVGVELAVQKQKFDVTPEQIENIKKSISFVDNNYVMKELNLSENAAHYIQGYYSRDGKIRLNIDAIGNEAEEGLVTVSHEALHKLSQHYDENGNLIPGSTGLKRNDIESRNVGMNEGVTQMYAARSTEEFTKEREETSYTNEVEVMKEYENIVGTDELLQAYKTGDIAFLSENMDSNIGMGVYDEFCNLIDEMNKCEENSDWHGVDKAKANAKKILESYHKAKGERKNE